MGGRPPAGGRVDAVAVLGRSAFCDGRTPLEVGPAPTAPSGRADGPVTFSFAGGAAADADGATAGLSGEAGAEPMMGSLVDEVAGAGAAGAASPVSRPATP